MDESKTGEVCERVGNLAEPMEGVEGGSTSEDVMIEVLGSDVFVDGVRSHGVDEEIDAAVVIEDDGRADNNKTTDDMDVDSKLPDDSSEPLVGESKETDLVKDGGIAEIDVQEGEKEIPDEEVGLVAETKTSIIVVAETETSVIVDDDEGLVEETQVVVDETNLFKETNDEGENPLEVDVVEETQLIDDDNEGLVEETQVVVDDKNLIKETNDEVEIENPLEGDDDVSHQLKSVVFVENVVDASSGDPVESIRPTGGSTTPVQEQDGSESAAADTVVATVEQDTTKLVPDQEEEHENVNVVNGVECQPFLVLEIPSSLGEDNSNPEAVSDDVSPILEESADVMLSEGKQADASGLEEVNTEEPSIEPLAPVSVEGEVKEIKEDNEGSSGVAVSNEEIQTEDKSRVEDVACSIEESVDGGGVLANDSEQPNQIAVASKAEEVNERTISSTFPVDENSKPEEDSKIDGSVDDVETASFISQTTEANMEVVTGSSEKEEIKPDELMGTTTNTNDDDQRSTKVVMNDITAAPPVPKPSFKIGECMSRVASQLTGSSAFPKHQHADPERNPNEKKHSFHDLLSRLQVAAQEPLKDHTSVNDNSSFDVIRNFFSDFRNSAVLEQNPELAKKGGNGGGSKRKRPSHLDDGSIEAFEFEDMNDSYWTDRVIANGVDEELLPSDGNGAVSITTAKRLENHIAPVELKPHKNGRGPYNKRRHLETSTTTTTTNHSNNEGLGFGREDKPDYIDPNAPAELVMIFSEFGFIPATEASLNRMFKRFGPLRESQTELDRDSCCAKVVFKKCSDAEVACSSAGRFNIFGPVHVIYQLNYTVSPRNQDYFHD